MVFRINTFIFFIIMELYFGLNNFFRILIIVLTVEELPSNSSHHKILNRGLFTFKVNIHNIYFCILKLLSGYLLQGNNKFYYYVPETLLILFISGYIYAFRGTKVTRF